MTSKFSFVFVLLVCGFPFVATAEIKNSRQVMVMQGSTDQLWLNYIFSIENTATKDLPAVFGLLFPKETADWAAQQGVKQEEIKLNEESGVVEIQKSFPPGQTLLGFGLNVKGSYGKAVMSFKLPYDLEEFIIMAPKSSSLRLSSDQMTKSDRFDFGQQRFGGLRLSDGKAGREITVIVSGLPEGRERFWLLGGSSGLLLLILALGFAYKSRPKLAGEDDFLVEGDR